MVELRWLTKDIPAPEFGEDFGKKGKVLQYRHMNFFANIFGSVLSRLGDPEWSEWKDVPVVKGCEHGRGVNDYCEPCGRVNGG